MKSLRSFYLEIVTGRRRGIGALLIGSFLGILSFLFHGILLLRKILYGFRVFRSVDLNVPVISVGNITWGGAGKTPLVMLIARYVAEKGRKPVILLRGYAGRAHLSDEAEIFKLELPQIPVLAGSDRLGLARDFLKDHKVDVFLLDDGFQHWRIKRDLEVLAIDATDPWGNGRLLPRGSLREPLSCLRRADLFVLTRTDLAKDSLPGLKHHIKQIKDAPVIHSRHNPKSLETLDRKKSLDLSYLKGRRVDAFCGIGNPLSFEATLRNLGAQVVRCFDFPDHHWYTAGDIHDVMEHARAQGVDCLVTTQKDSVKIREFVSHFEPIPCLVLNIELDLTEGKNALFHRVDNLLHG